MSPAAPPPLSPTPIDLTQDYAAAARLPPQDGYGVQVYAGAQGYSDQKLLDRLPELAEADVALLVHHGFVGDLSRAKYEAWAGAVKARAPGMMTGAAFGYGGFNRDHPEEVGRWTAAVFGSPLCEMALDDAEGAFDNGAKAKAYAMVQARLAALGGRPACPVGNQLWEAVLHHPNFPVVEWLPTTTFWAEQEYGNDWPGAHRWEDARALRDGDWAREEARLPANLRLPHVATTQGYGFALDTPKPEVPWEAVTELLRWPRTTLWCEWYPSTTMLMALRFVRFLKARGYALTPDGAGVRAFQRDAGVAADGKAGWATMAAAGIAKPTAVRRFFMRLAGRS